MQHAYLFEVKSIQPYIFESGKLRDVVGASELVDSLTESLLKDALTALELEEGREIHFSRRAGGAFYMFSEDGEVMDRLVALWGLLVQQYAPGIAFDSGCDSGGTTLEAFDNARKKLRADNSRMHPRLPVAAPLVARSRRTGGIAVAYDEEDSPMDAATARKKCFTDPSRVGLTGRFSPLEANLDWHDWPRDMDTDREGAFPFLGEDRTVALIRADGNGLGQLLINAKAVAKPQPEQFISNFRALSEGIGEATRNAVRIATRDVLIPEKRDRGGGPLAARPIVLGGDDLTILVRGDLAMPFVRAFLAAFESESTAVLARLKGHNFPNLSERLTAGAGLVYLRASQPFYLAVRLAESLMDEAKRLAKKHDPDRPPSSLVFHRVTAALIDDYAAIVDREKTTRDGEATYVQTMGAYFLDRIDGLPALEDLLALQALLQGEGMARGPTRQLLTLMGLSPTQARMHYRRWRQQMRKNKSSQLERFDKLLKMLAPEFDGIKGDLPFGGQGNLWLSPLGDVVPLMAAKNALPDNGTKAKEDAA